jgi:mono/diheme cytochrome c family protein
MRPPIEMQLWFHIDWKRVWRRLVAAGGMMACVSGFAQDSAIPASAAPEEPGLVVTCTSVAVKAVDAWVAPNVWLYVPAGKPPTPFMPGGGFTAEWDGSVNADARGDYVFKAELNGSLKLEINGAVALDTTGANGVSAPGKSVQLNRGTNVLKAWFTSPARGDAYVRLLWKPSDSFFQPVPIETLTHSGGVRNLAEAGQVHRGRELFAEFRCAKCHAVAGAETAMPELAMDAPSFEGIGSRRNQEWMARWIQDPKALRPTAHMPRVLHGAAAKDDAGAIAAYLASLKSGEALPAPERADQADDGRALFESLHCAACHNGPDATEIDERKIFLKQTREKFAPGALAAFLQKPDAHYAWIRMPDFKLSGEQADQLAAYLDAAADKPQGTAAPAGDAVIEHGKKLVQTSGCLKCHALKLDNQFSARALAELTPDKWKRGCLAATPEDAGAAPWFGFTADEREALQAFGGTDRASLTRVVPAEFAERESRLLNCRECHGKVQGIPAFDVLGGKLKPEWSRAFIAGEISYKPRPWLEARMPAFPKYAELMATGLAMQQGFPPQSAVEPPVDTEAAKIGQKLMSTMGGFSCVSCHAVGPVAAAQGGDTAGVNFIYTGSRVTRDYFERWLRYPQLIDPSTKMPAYFQDQAKSPLTNVLDGDAAKQINALWEYLQLGDKMPPPPK